MHVAGQKGLSIVLKCSQANDKTLSIEFKRFKHHQANNKTMSVEYKGFKLSLFIITLECFLTISINLYFQQLDSIITQGRIFTEIMKYFLVFLILFADF